MSNKTVFVRTSKGEAEASGQTSLLFGEAKRVFMLVNNKSSVDELRKHAAPSLRTIIEEVLEQLEQDDFIREKDDAGDKKSPASSGGSMAKIAMPKIAVPEKPATYYEDESAAAEELDFSTLGQPAQPPVQPPVQPPSAPMAETNFSDDLDFSSLAQSVSQGSDSKPKEEAKPKKPEIDFASILQLPGQGSGTEKAQADLEAKKRAEAEARMRAEMEAKKRAEGEAWARAEMETKKRRAEAEAKARAEAEARTRNDVEARIRAEMEARKRTESEAAAKARMEAEAKAKADAAARARIEAETRARAEAEARARIEAEARAKAEAAARARIEAEARARAEAEARARIEAEARAKAEAAARARLEAEARARAEAEARMRLEIAARARAEAEAEAKRKTADELDFSSILQMPVQSAAPDPIAEAEAKARMEVEARMRAEEEAKARALAEQEEKVRAEEQAKARLRAELEAGIRTPPPAVDPRILAVDPRLITGQHNAPRSMIATVLFFDVVGYTKQSVTKQIELKGQFNSLISGMIRHIDEDQRIILDTGDGAAIGFLQHPEDALDVAMKFRAAVTANGHRNFPELKVRVGIHLGPVNVMKDMNGLLNMVGDGINDAQRIMSFAGMDQIYVSRAYFDVISRLTADSARLFKYNGTLKDKHGREHQVYQVLGEGPASPAYAMPQQTGGVESLLQDLSSMLKEAETSDDQAPWQPMGVPGAAQAKSPQEIEAEARRAAQIKAEQEAEAARAKAQQEAIARARAEQEEAARRLAADQARAFAEAERRAQQQADHEARTSEEEPRKPVKRQASAKPQKVQRARRPRGPLPLMKIGLSVLFLAVVGILALPYVWPFIWPMQEVVAEVEHELSGQLKQPVHIGSLSTVALPSPRMDLQDITIGGQKELKIGHMSLYFNVLTLPASIKEINKAEMNDVTISAPSFDSVANWLQAMGANEHYPLARVTLHSVHLSGDAPSLPAIGGTLDFDANGRFAKASLFSSDDKIGLTLQPRDKHLQLEVNISDTSLPLLPKIHVAGLDMTGDVGDGTINFSSFAANMYGGVVRGNASLSWRGGWQLQGHLTAGSIKIDKALPNLKITGDMDGDATFSMSADKLSQLTSAPRLDGSFTIKDGTINSMDLAETARSGEHQLSPGTTHFDVLSGTLRIDGSGQHVKPIKVSAGAMSMTGTADATPDGRLTGQLQVDLNKVRAGMGTLPLVLTGSVSEPVWSIGRH